MTFANQGDQYQLNRLTLADNHFFDIGGDSIDRLFDILHTAPLDLFIVFRRCTAQVYHILWRLGCTIGRTLISFSFTSFLRGAFGPRPLGWGALITVLRA